MIIDVNRVLVDYDGKALEFRPEQLQPMREMRVKDVLFPPLLVPQKSLSWEEHLRRDDLARKIYSAQAPIELSLEDVLFLKRAICNSGFSSIAVVQVGKILEGQH